MHWDDSTFQADLRAAVREDRHLEVRELLAGLRRHLDRSDVERYDGAEAVLRTLQGPGRFDDMVRIGRVFADLDSGACVMRRYAQALIDTGEVTKAISVLSGLDRGTAPLGPEQPEVMGLLGRAYKQLYVDAKPVPEEPRQDDLDRALHFYETMYKADRTANTWHGINVVALLHHAAGVMDNDHGRTHRERRDELAREVLATTTAQLDPESTPPDAHWIAATAMEACLPFPGREERALGHLETYIHHPTVDAFALRSTLRQLRELWRLVASEPPGSFLLPPLMNRLIELGGVGVDLLGSGLGEERIFGKDRPRSCEWLRRGLDCARAVGRVEEFEDEGVGTCFLVARELVLTNHHVVPGGLPAEHATVAFFGLDPTGRTRRRVSRVLRCRDQLQLDASLLELDQPVGDDYTPLELGAVHPYQVRPERRAFVTGHPEGGRLSISLYDSRILAANQQVVQYRTPTRRGSSGSPVFDESWRLIGLHRRGHERLRHAVTGDRIEANEAIRIDAILPQVGPLLDPRERGAGR